MKYIYIYIYMYNYIACVYTYYNSIYISLTGAKMSTHGPQLLNDDRGKVFSEPTASPVDPTVTLQKSAQSL